MPTSPISNSPVVLIAASESVPVLNVRDYFDRETLVFPDSECLRALEAIVEHRPSLIVLEQIFAATPRGAALINQIRSDPALSSSEICLFSPGGDKGRVERGERSGGFVAGVQPLPDDYRGTRAAERFTIPSGLKVQLDGESAVLLDFSKTGVRILCPRILRPAQQVRLALVLEKKCLRIGALVVWASFEPARGTGRPKYRAGLQFSQADPKRIAAFWTALVEERAADSGAREQPRLASDPLLLACPGGPRSVL